MDTTLIGDRQRIRSIDVLRGFIMLIMALDHTRDFFHQPAMLYQPTDLSVTTAAIFFTRWITHFCAPVFLFLSGMSAFLSGLRKTKAQLSRFLVTRGLWLIFVEIVIMSLIFSFNPYYNLIVLVVIWAIGWSMIILGLLVRGSYALVLVTGLVIVFAHNILDYIPLPANGAGAALVKIFFTTAGFVIPLSSSRVVLFAYAILPWTGIMLLGYAFGTVYKPSVEAGTRRRILVRTGLIFIFLFLLLRFLNAYGDPAPWASQPRGAIFSVLSFLNVTKYPVSLQYTCMTLGPALLFLAFIERKNNAFTRFASVYGSVPFFYYVFHFFLLHVLCTVVFFATGHNFSQAADPGTPFLFRPAFFGYPLWVVYLIWLSVILALYYPCRWFSRYKKTHSAWWLSYL